MHKPRLHLCPPDQLTESHPSDLDYLLLVTPDTRLDPSAPAHLLTCAARIARYDPTPAILVGATRCPQAGTLATSALNRTAPRARSYTRIEPTLACLPADTFDPNCVLFPRVALASLRNAPHPLTPGFGLRLRRLGFNIFLAPNYVGTCPLPSRRGRAQRRPGFSVQGA